LFCYTDGVTEAHRPSGEEFSEHRCLEILDRMRSPVLSELLEAIRQEVRVFRGRDQVDDDCTMLALRLPAIKAE
jgi:sigma-B regulation protein RsbU (phosphoserine phosphatase)